MAGSSTVVATKVSLLAQLAAAINAVEDPEIRVDYSHPGSELKLEHVYLGDLKSGLSSIANLRAGRKKREEQYTLEVVFEVCKEGFSAQAAETRSLELYAYLEDLLAETPGLGSADPTFRAWIVEFTTNLVHDEATRGWRCRLTADVLCQNRLT